MTTESGRAANESQIRTVIDDRTKALGGKDRIRATSGIAPDTLAFDVVTKLQNIGSDASGKRVEEWFASFQGPANSLGHMIAWVSEVARPQNREIMLTSVLKAIGYFEAPRKFQHDCGGNHRVEGGQIWLHLPVSTMGMSEALR